MSKSTYDDLKVRLNNLKKTQRPAIIDEIASARSNGDLAENAEYQAAKEKQIQIEEEILTLEDKLARSEIITASAKDAGHIIFGATVRVKDLNTQKELEYTLVGPDGVNVSERKISSVSPIGKGLMGRKVGDVIRVKTPKSVRELEVLSFQ